VLTTVRGAVVVVVDEVEAGVEEGSEIEREGAVELEVLAAVVELVDAAGIELNNPPPIDELDGAVVVLKLKPVDGVAPPTTVRGAEVAVAPVPKAKPVDVEAGAAPVVPVVAGVLNPPNKEEVVEGVEVEVEGAAIKLLPPKFKAPAGVVAVDADVVAPPKENGVEVDEVVAGVVAVVALNPKEGAAEVAGAVAVVVVGAPPNNELVEVVAGAEVEAAGKEKPVETG
jgi:hypothetical protein